MRNSYILPYHPDQVTLNYQIIDQLSIRRNCTVYGVEATETRDHIPSAVFSTIPYSRWASAYRLTLNTAGKIGSLCEATRLLADEFEVNILSAWAAAICTSGEVNLTAIVELPRHGFGDLPLDEERRALLEFSDEVENSLKNEGVLSQSRVFDRDKGVPCVRCLPLVVLRRLREIYDGNPTYVAEIKDWNLALDIRSREGHDTLLEHLRPHNGYPDARTGRVLVTPDTEDRYFRLAFLGANRLRLISFPVTVVSHAEVFGGVFHDALSALESLSLNVYSARDIVESKTEIGSDASHDDDGSGEASAEQERKTHEKASFSFVVDAGLKRDEAKLRSRVRRELVHNLGKKRKNRSVEVAQDEIICRPITGLEIPVFLATNAHPKRSKPYIIKWALALISELRMFSLNPVNVEIQRSGGSMRGEVVRLLDACPMLVAFYVPEKDMEIERGRRERFAASAWTIYEEAYMTHKRPDYVFRMRHKKVESPSFTERVREFEFTQGNFKEVLLRLRSAVGERMRSPDWWKQVDECAAYQEEVKADLLDRDLEGWLTEQND